MASRKPVINALKDQEIIGESNKGFLEYRTANKPQQQLVADENKDRELAYRGIGKQTGTSDAHVGARRAKQIADHGKAGHWFQKADGSWYKK
jgi:uncharacterized protein YdbL (DUF1318 family)